MVFVSQLHTQLTVCIN